MHNGQTYYAIVPLLTDKKTTGHGDFAHMLQIPQCQPERKWKRERERERGGREIDIEQREKEREREKVEMIGFFADSVKIKDNLE